MTRKKPAAGDKAKSEPRTVLEIRAARREVEAEIQRLNRNHAFLSDGLNARPGGYSSPTSWPMWVEVENVASPANPTPKERIEIAEAQAKWPDPPPAPPELEPEARPIGLADVRAAFGADPNKLRVLSELLARVEVLEELEAARGLPQPATPLRPVASGERGMLGRRLRLS